MTTPPWVELTCVMMVDRLGEPFADVCSMFFIYRTTNLDTTFLSNGFTRLLPTATLRELIQLLPYLELVYNDSLVRAQIFFQDTEDFENRLRRASRG